MKPEVESQPSFSIKRDSPVKMPVYLLLSLLVVTAMATLIYADLRREVADQRRDVIEAQRVNTAQDRRFEYLESAASKNAILENDVRWLERQERQRHP